MKGNLKLLISAVLFSTLLFVACDKQHLYDPQNNKDQEVNLGNYFDFATTKTVQLNISYDVAGKTLFEVYGQNPFMVKDGQVVKNSDLIALAVGFTDKDGHYNMSAVLPASTEKVYIYSPYYNVPTLYEATVSEDAVNADITFENAFDISTLVAVTAKSVVTKSGIIPDLNHYWPNIRSHIPNRLATWAWSGKPDNLNEEPRMVVDEKINEYITAYLPDKVNNTGAFTNSPDISVSEDTENVTIYYVGGQTGAHSVFAYYCYPENASVAEIKEAASHAYIIFANAHPYNDYVTAADRKKVLTAGDAVRLKYITPEGKATSNTFPKGTKIGFLLWNNGWGNDLAPFKDVFYSTRELNADGLSCIALLKVKDVNGNNRTIMGFEDYPAGDRDYNDVIFSTNLQLEEEVLPDPDPVYTTQTFQGILGFEDNWPNQGDYDMNDVVVKYNSTMALDKDNKIISITDKFTLSWTGANFRNGFGFEYPVEVSREELTLPANAEFKDNVVYLFANAKKEMNVADVPPLEMINNTPQEVSYRVTVKFKTPIEKGIIAPPYNPFITINGTNNEVHLTDFKPTKFATNVFDGSAADISEGNGHWFVCKDNFPFAIHLDAREDQEIMNIDLKNEEIRIDRTYSKFAEWAVDRDPTIKWWKK